MGRHPEIQDGSRGPSTSTLADDLGIPTRLRSRVRPDDRAYVPGETGNPLDDLCQWDDEATHVDDVRLVVVVAPSEPYSEALGRFCMTHYLAVLEGRDA